jgi:ppGpp synthetase/RelA/SpoT-type nucleotidyltranferase
VEGCLQADLKTFKAILRTRTRGTRIVVAQRHKRKSTIVDKLARIPGMQLSRMDDIAGCRLIFKSIRALYDFRKEFHKAKFYHRMRNEIDKYDYIKKPKATGYRGVHDVYEYNVKSEVGRHLEGLLIEVQYRTLVQHSWATTVELIGIITENQPKFQKGDKRYEQIMALSSEILARAFEKMNGPFPGMSDATLIKEFRRMDKELKLMKVLRALNFSQEVITHSKNVILLLSDYRDLRIRTYRQATDAIESLFQLEKEYPSDDIVYVRADSSEDVRLSYRNYFTDARDFLKMMDKGIQKLTP